MPLFLFTSFDMEVLAMQYDQPLFRPPSEAESLILQVTLGCSHNVCTFCSMYRTKRFRPRPQAEVERDIQSMSDMVGDHVRRVFLADGDAMCLSTRRLLELLAPINQAFPRLQRVSAYANARDILRKSDSELRQLRDQKLRLIYMGLESGDEQILRHIKKGATSDEIAEAARRAKAAGLATSVMVLIGLGGKERSLQHARASARVINAMVPTYTALLTYTPVAGTPFHDELERGDLHLPSPEESLLEIRTFLADLDCPTYFTCNHASNYLPLRGKLPEARDGLINLLDSALRGEVPLKPEFLRGL